MTSTSAARRTPRSEVRSDILDAATASFLTHGYRGTNISELAAQAGYSKGAVYSNFGGKPELFGEVMNRRAAELTGAALAEFDVRFSADHGPVDSESAVRDLIVALTDLVLAQRNWPNLMSEFRALAAEDDQLRPIYAQWRRRQRDRLAGQIAERRAALALTGELNTQAAATLLMMVITALELEQRAAPDVTDRTMIESVLELALRNVIA